MKHFGDGIIYDIERVKNIHSQFIKKQWSEVIFHSSDVLWSVDEAELSVFSQLKNLQGESLGVLNTFVSEEGVEHILLDKTGRDVLASWE